MNLDQFKRKYGRDRQCLEYIMRKRYPVCKCGSRFYPIKNRTSYSCKLGHQVYPLVGTIFEGSSTKLSSWFFAIYLMSQTRNGISAKFLQRVLGVTYKTAWRMLNKIRSLMGEYVQLEGQIEVDETYWGGKNWFRGRKWWSNYREPPKVIVMGLVERKGRVKTVIVENADTPNLIHHIKMYTKPGSQIFTDKLLSYKPLPRFGYTHKTVNHSLQFVDSNDPEAHIQTIEGFWSQMRQGIIGTYRTVSRRYLPNYCDEFTFRRNHSDIFGDLLGKALPEELPF